MRNQESHPDNDAIDRFSFAMKEKMAKSRMKGRDGWSNKELCTGEQLAFMLIEHISKGNNGNFEDVAIFAMMLHQRGENPELLSNAMRDNHKKALLNITDESVIPRWADPTTNNGDLRPDHKFRSGWNACREATKNNIESLMLD